MVFHSSLGLSDVRAPQSTYGLVVRAMHVIVSRLKFADGSVLVQELKNRCDGTLELSMGFAVLDA